MYVCNHHRNSNYHQHRKQPCATRNPSILPSIRPTIQPSNRTYIHLFIHPIGIDLGIHCHHCVLLAPLRAAHVRNARLFGQQTIRKRKPKQRKNCQIDTQTSWKFDRKPCQPYRTDSKKKRKQMQMQTKMFRVKREWKKLWKVMAGMQMRIIGAFLVIRTALRLLRSIKMQKRSWANTDTYIHLFTQRQLLFLIVAWCHYHFLHLPKQRICLRVRISIRIRFY